MDKYLAKYTCLTDLEGFGDFCVENYYFRFEVGSVGGVRKKAQREFERIIKNHDFVKMESLRLKSLLSTIIC